MILLKKGLIVFILFYMKHLQIIRLLIIELIFFSTVKRTQRRYLMAAHNEINKDAEKTIEMNAKTPKLEQSKGEK